MERKLFEIFKGGISANVIKAQQMNINNNNKVKVKYINLDKFYKKENEFSKEEIDKFINDNPNLFKNEFIDFEYAKITPENVTGQKEFNDLYFEKIDEIENNISDADSLFDLLKNFESIEIIQKKEFQKIQTMAIFKKFTIIETIKKFRLLKIIIIF